MRLIAKSSLFLILACRLNLFSSFSRSMSSEIPSKAYELVLDPFGLRQFNNKDYTGTQVHYDEAAFERNVNEYYQAGYPLIDGYAPFW
jgi:hypothetical protein